MREPLILPMMMYGRFRRERAARDENGNTIILGRYKNGTIKYKREKYWVIHDEKNGDPGVYPSVNKIYTRTRNGGQRLIKPAEELKERWAGLAMAWASNTGWKTTEKEKVVIETTAFFPPDNIRRDINNVFKLMMDSFTGVIYDDDEYVLPRVIDFHKVKDGEKPYFLLNIYKLSEEEDILLERLREKEII